MRNRRPKSAKLIENFIDTNETKRCIFYVNINKSYTELFTLSYRAQLVQPRATAELLCNPGAQINSHGAHNCDVILMWFRVVYN